MGKTPTTSTSRRKLLQGLWLGLGGAVAAEFIWLGLRLFSRRKKTRKAGKKVVEAGRIDEFKQGTATAIGPGGFFLVRLQDGAFLALSRTCTHLGCSVTWEEKEHCFLCPCHGTAFDLKGEVEKGPAPRPLDTYPVRLEDGSVRVEISQARRRDHFEPGQTARPL